MNIVVRGGHNVIAVGAAGLMDEVTEDRLVTSAIVAPLRSLGHSVWDVSPWGMDSDSDLVYGVNQAKKLGADLFVSIHFNKAYSSYDGAIGSECWVYSKSDNLDDEVYAQRIVNSLGGLGFKNRGVKTSTELYELRKCREYGIPAIIVEVCFVEATEDVSLYKRLGPGKIATTIASAICDKQISVQSPSTGSTGSTTPTPSTSNKQYLNLPGSAGLWNVYPLDKAPVVANSCGKVNPSICNGLSYEILGKPQTDVCIIQTSDFGKVQIYSASSTGASITSSPVYGVVTKTPTPAPAPSKPAVSGSYGVVTADVLNVRKGAGTNYGVIGQLKNGDKVKLANKVGQWWCLYYGTNGGFVHGDYIQVL